MNAALRLGVALAAASVLILHFILRWKAQRYLVYRGESKVDHLSGFDYLRREHYAAEGWPLVKWLQSLLAAWIVLAPLAIWVWMTK